MSELKNELRGEHKSSTRQKVEELRKLIQFATDKLTKIQDECFHPKKRHRQLTQNGYTHTNTDCVECGLMLSCSCGAMGLEDGVKEWQTED